MQRGIDSSLLPSEKSAQFFRAAAFPDIANTQLFKSSGFGYVHTLEFAEYLLGLALCCHTLGNRSRVDPF